MADPDRADEPFDIRTGAVMAHEYYTSLRTAGFAHGEAMYLVACVLTGGPKPPTEGGPGGT